MIYQTKKRKGKVYPYYVWRPRRIDGHIVWLQYIYRYGEHTYGDQWKWTYVLPWNIMTFRPSHITPKAMEIIKRSGIWKDEGYKDTDVGRICAGRLTKDQERMEKERQKKDDLDLL